VRSSVISQTFRQEIEGGYLWSPKRNKNGHRNPFYEFMREVAPGDIVFSFFDTRIAALGIVGGFCRESPKPEEFGNAGANWSQIGWRVASPPWYRSSECVANSSTATTWGMAGGIGSSLNPRLHQRSATAPCRSVSQARMLVRLMNSSRTWLRRYRWTRLFTSYSPTTR